MTSLKKGLLVALEGIDGTGKTTLIRQLEEYFSKRGLSVRTLREPTDGKYGQEIRRLGREGRHQVTPEQELDLFIRDRIEDCEKNIRPALAKNELVLIDRYYFSTVAYQGALGLETDRIWEMNEKIAVIPDLVLILDLPVDRSLKRITDHRKDEHDDFEKADFLEKAREIFISMNRPYICLIDADRDPESVFSDIREKIERLIGEHLSLPTDTGKS